MTLLHEAQDGSQLSGKHRNPRVTLTPSLCLKFTKVYSIRSLARPSRLITWGTQSSLHVKVTHITVAMLSFFTFDHQVPSSKFIVRNCHLVTAIVT